MRAAERIEPLRVCTGIEIGSYDRLAFRPSLQFGKDLLHYGGDIACKLLRRIGKRRKLVFPPIVFQSITVLGHLIHAPDDAKLPLVVAQYLRWVRLAPADMRLDDEDKHEQAIRKPTKVFPQFLPHLLGIDRAVGAPYPRRRSCKRTVRRRQINANGEDVEPLLRHRRHRRMPVRHGKGRRLVNARHNAPPVDVEIGSITFANKPGHAFLPLCEGGIKRSIRQDILWILLDFRETVLLRRQGRIKPHRPAVYLGYLDRIALPFYRERDSPRSIGQLDLVDRNGIVRRDAGIAAISHSRIDAPALHCHVSRAECTLLDLSDRSPPDDGARRIVCRDKRMDVGERRHSDFTP